MKSSERKMFLLLAELQLLPLNFYLFQSFNYTCNLYYNYLCQKFFTLKGNMFSYDEIMKLLCLLSFVFFMFFMNEIL